MIGRPYIQLLLIVALLFTVESSVFAANNRVISVSATVLSKNKCKFGNLPGNTSPALAFGNLDPTNPVPVSVSTTITFSCGGSAPLATFSVSSGNGLHFSSGKRRMQNSTDLAVYIPYDLTLTPQTATVPKSVDQLLTIRGDIAGADYQFATAGILYTDQVVLSITP